MNRLWYKFREFPKSVYTRDFLPFLWLELFKGVEFTIENKNKTLSFVRFFSEQTNKHESFWILHEAISSHCSVVRIGQDLSLHRNHSVVANPNADWWDV